MNIKLKKKKSFFDELIQKNLFVNIKYKDRYNFEILFFETKDGRHLKAFQITIKSTYNYNEIQLIPFTSKYDISSYVLRMNTPDNFFIEGSNKYEIKNIYPKFLNISNEFQTFVIDSTPFVIEIDTHDVAKKVYKKITDNIAIERLMMKIKAELLTDVIDFLRAQDEEFGTDKADKLKQKILK